MKILLVHPAKLPVHAYGGTERVVWDLGKALVAMGHHVTYLASPGSRCPFAPVRAVDSTRPLMEQIHRNEQDIVHFQFNPPQVPDFPHLITEHGNSKVSSPLPLNTVFLSQDHAARHGSSHFVYNGLDWTSYGAVDMQRPRHHFHFLAKGSWPVKNLKGAIQVARSAQVPLAVLGARRLNLSRGFRFTPWPSIRFMGMVGGEQKFDALNASKGMIFPVRWHEPFGLAVIESLYFGCPVFATPFGALPELVTEACGVLALEGQTLAQALTERTFNPMDCHHRARTFDHLRMARGYLEKYEQVLCGTPLHSTSPRLPENGHRLQPWHM